MRGQRVKNELNEFTMKEVMFSAVLVGCMESTVFSNVKLKITK